MTTRCRSGYTLFELLLVLGIRVILAVLAYPSIEAMLGEFRVEAAVDAVRAAPGGARCPGNHRGPVVPLRRHDEPGRVPPAPDSSDFGPDSETGSTPPDPNNPPLVLKGKLPKNVTFNQADNPQSASTPASTLQTKDISTGTWTTVVTFLPDGTASQDVQMVFQTRGTKPLTLELRAFTSVVTVRKQ